MLDVEQVEAGVEVVVVRGEHDLATAGDLRDCIQTAVSRASGVVIDLTQATFIDSAVLQALLSGRDRAHAAGIAYVIALDDGTGHAVTRLLELTGLDRQLELEQGRADAIRAAAPRDGAIPAAAPRDGATP
jgi:anti-sigma B factor antagonist